MIEGVKRSASVADLAGVSFNQLLRCYYRSSTKNCARGGAVIGNSFKTIFARIQDKGVLSDLQDLGVEVTGASKEILPATQILGNLSKQFGQLSKIQQTDLAKKLGGIYQLDKLLAGLEDLSSANSVARESAELAASAQNQAYEKNLLLNQTLAEVINRVTINAQELGAKLGALGVTDSLKNILSFFNNLLEGVQNLLGEESGLGKFVRGIVKGISEIVTGPGLALFAAIIVKLSKDLVVFGAQSLKSFFGIGKAAKDIKDLETSIKSALASNVDLQEQILKLGNDRYSQMKLITSEIQKQEVAQRTLQKISSDLSSPAYKIGIRAGEQGLRFNPPKKNAAEGYIPAFAQEKQNIRKGVGGAKSGDKPVTLENFNFGGGKKGSIVAHTGEYVVPNFGGGSGSAIFNRDMVRKMGLPSGARKINAAGGFIPNFAKAKIPDESGSLQEFTEYFGGQGEDKNYSAMRRVDEYYQAKQGIRKVGSGKDEINPKYIVENRIAGAIKTSLKRAPFTLDANKFKFPNGSGLGVVTLNKTTESVMGEIPLDSETFNKIGAKDLVARGFLESKFQNELKAQGISIEQINQFREDFKKRNIDLGFQQGDSLDSKLSLSNIRVSDFSTIQAKGAEKQDQFQQTINGLFAGPLASLANQIFGGAIGSIDPKAMTSKYLFGKDVLGNIYESAIELYTKGAENLPAFAEGEAERGKSFDFPLNDANQAKRLNEIFFPGNAVGRADAKYTTGTSQLASMLRKSLDDEDTLKQIRQQIGSKGVGMAFARGFIPNFANPLKEAIDREIAAGVPASQIYIDKNSSLKNAMNPMGLMVANRRDEPAGGIQGINRARKEGEDPMMYGAAYGLIPNFVKRKKRNYPTAKTTTSPATTSPATASTANVTASTTQATQATASLAAIMGEYRTEVDALIKTLNKQIKAGKITRQEAGQKLEEFGSGKLKGQVSDSRVEKLTARSFDKLVPDEASKGMSDFVGKLFLMQSVASGVTASLSELGEEYDKAAQGVSSFLAGTLSVMEFLDMFKNMGRQQAIGRESTKNFLSANTQRKRSAALAEMEAVAASGTPGAPGGVSRFLARRAAAVPTGAISKGVGGASRMALSLISKVGPIFGRLIPIVGIAVTAFQAVSGIAKLFGFDLNKIVSDGLTKFGQSLGIVATDAEKLSKSFEKNSKEIASSLNTGKVEKGTSAFQKTIGEALTKATEKEIASKLRDEKQKKDKDNASTNYTNQLLDDQIFIKNKEFFAKRAGLTPEELQKQFEKDGFGGLQKIGGVGVRRADNTGRTFKGVSKAQADAIATLEKDLIGQFGSAETQKAFGEAVSSGDFEKQKLLIEQLSAEADKKLTELGKSGDVQKLRQTIAEGGDLEDPQKLREVYRAINSILKDSVKAEEVQKQLNLVDLQIAQQKLDNLIKYKTALLDIPVIRDNELSIEKELINTTDARKVSIERELTARKAVIDLTKQQTEAAAAFLKDQGAIQAILQKAGINEATEESFREVASIVGGVSDQIRLQGGYTDDVAKSTEELLQSKLKSKEAVQRISELLKGQMTALSDQQQIQLAIQDIELKRNSIHEARNTLLKMENDQKLQAIDSAKEELSYQEKIQDLASRSFKTRADALKEVSPKSIQFDVEGLQNFRDRASARLKNTNQQQSIFRDLQKDLLGTALEKNFQGLADKIQKATNLQGLESIGKELVEAEKEAAIEKLNAAFKEKESTIYTANAFRDIVVNAAEQLARTLDKNYQTLGEKIQTKVQELSYAIKSSPQEVPRLQGELRNLQTQRKDAGFQARFTDSLPQLERDRAAQELAIRSSSGFSEAILKVKQALNSSSFASKDMLATLEELDFSFRAAAIKIEKNFAKLMLSFSNQIAQEERKNIGLAGRIERLGMVRDFETENKANYSNIVDPQEYLKRQQSISLDYFNKIQALELEKANREIEIQFKTEQMNLENIKQLILNTEALRQLRDELSKDPALKGTDVSEFTKPGSPTENFTSYYARTEAGLRSSRFSMAGSSSSGPYSSSMITVPIYDDIKTATTKINQMQEAAKNVVSKGGDFVTASQEAAKNLGIAGYDVNDVAKTILDLANKYANNKAQFEQAGKTYSLSQDLEEKRSKAGTFKQGVEQGFRDLNQRRAEFANQFGKDIPKMFSDGMSGAINSAIEGTVSLKDGLRSAAYEFVKTINQRMMSNLVDKIVGGTGQAAMETGGTGGGGIMSFFSNMFAAGGKVTGGSGSKDDVPAMLMGGEYVVNKRAVAKYGPQFLEAINNGTLAGYAKGGKIQRGPQGNFYTPGTFGQGAIEGKMKPFGFRYSNWHIWKIRSND
jgi:hypothetical protein